MKKVTSTCAFMFCASFLFSQLDPRFHNLDFTNCNTGHFWNQIPELIDLPDGSDYTMLDLNQTSVILHDFNKANIDESNPIVPDYLDLKESFFQNNLQEHVIPISIIEMAVNYVKPSSIENQEIFVVNGELWQLPSINVLDTYSTLVLHMDASHYQSGHLKFKLFPDYYFQNFGSLPGNIEIDFDDGVGFQTISLNEVISVHYNAINTDRQIRLKLTRGEVIKKAGFRLKSGVDDCPPGNYDSPVTPVPWDTNILPDDPDMLWRIATTYEGQEVCGNAYYLPSGAFDKPFIFVEGIDFPYNTEGNTSPQRNGEFGWCQFSSGYSAPDYPYSILELMPELLNAVRENGYDIILEIPSKLTT